MSKEADEIRAAMEARSKMPETPPTALELIERERSRQVYKEGWTPEHDDEHDGDQLARAAASYAMPAWVRDEGIVTHANRYGFERPLGWHVLPAGWVLKPTPNDRIRELVKAGALIVAEIERLQRAAADSAEANR